MKEGIHPKYFDVEARCACGATWKTRSTKQELHLEICNNCHPFFTGRQKLIDTEGRVERFTKRFGAQTSESRKQAAKSKKQPAAAKAELRKQLSTAVPAGRPGELPLEPRQPVAQAIGPRAGSARFLQRKQRQFPCRREIAVAMLVVYRERFGGKVA